MNLFFSEKIHDRELPLAFSKWQFQEEVIKRLISGPPRAPPQGVLCVNFFPFLVKTDYSLIFFESKS